MHPFDFAHASEVAPAITSGARDGAKFIAGGTNLVDLMKCNVEKPSHVVDINALPLAHVERVAHGIRIGALAQFIEQPRILDCDDCLRREMG